MKTICKLIVIFLAFVSLEAKILEVNQLFNKEIVKVKDETVYETKSFYGEVISS